MTGQFGAGYTYFTVASVTDGRPAATSRVFGSQNTSPNNCYFSLLFTTGGAHNASVIQAGTSRSTTLATFADGQSSDFLSSTTANPLGNLQGYFNGIAAGTPGDLTALTWASIADADSETIAIGAFLNDGFSPNSFISGTIKSLIIYNRPLSTTELTVIHRYLGAKYAITVP